MTAMPLPPSASDHSRFPSFARTATVPLLNMVTYCRTPPASRMTRETYSAASFTSVARQTTSPVFLLKAAIAPSFPPGVAIRLSPSSSTDSQYPQTPTAPLQSVLKFFCHTVLPVARSRQPRSPLAPRAYRRSPSTVGVLRGPPPQLFR